MEYNLYSMLRKGESIQNGHSLGWDCEWEGSDHKFVHGYFWSGESVLMLRFQR